MAFLSKKAFYDPQKATGNLVTTIVGVATSVLSVLVLLNVISLDLQGELQGYVLTLKEAVVAIIGVVQGVIAMFKATD
ncbi:MAG: hypothetical protein JXM68_12115 [Sedimentisphaerales bacterium]|nr:hypothetical protein [Sedimentisphaerales bacterium]